MSGVVTEIEVTRGTLVEPVDQFAQIAAAKLALFPTLEGFSDRQESAPQLDRKSTRLNSSHSQISYAVFCLKKKKHTSNARVTLNAQACTLRTCALSNMRYTY